jgi:hypothetical protein
MAEPIMRTESKAAMAEPARAVQGEGPLLAAALAATLVEHRRLVLRRNEHDDQEMVGANWRVMGRWQQLHGRR